MVTKLSWGTWSPLHCRCIEAGSLLPLAVLARRDGASLAGALGWTGLTGGERESSGSVQPA